jgi:hypothetical protein
MSFLGFFDARKRRVVAMAMLATVASATSTSGCELCAIYSANNSRDDSGSGFTLTLSEQYVSQHNLQLDGKSITGFPFYNSAFLDSSYSHIVPSYNFCSRIGLSLNAPIIHREFHRTQQASPSGQIYDEMGSLTGLGDVALIARLNLLQKVKMKYSININLLAGVKFPTGDTARLDDEVGLAKADLATYGTGHQHGLTGGIHEHDLALGSGSYDGVFGVTSNFRWRKWFLNNQIQYYLRTEGHDYKFGDMIIVSGGPGWILPLGSQATVSLQANAFYESNARDQLIGQIFNQTGMTGWYLGPLLSLTLGQHFSATAGVELPLRIYNHGLQTVPDYRVHGGLTWRF